MSFSLCKKGALEYWACDGLRGTVHGFSTRLGGVSQGYLSSLNLGAHRGDAPENVVKNYEILGNSLGFSPEDTVFAKQLHTGIVRRVGRADRGAGLFRPVEEPRDGLVTNEPGVALTIFSADCTPILFYDPAAKAIGGCHAGWRGTAAGIAKNTVEAMVREFGSDPGNIRAAIGPCIGFCCFETHSDVPEAMSEALGQEAWAAMERLENGKFRVDLKALNALWLKRAGVRDVSVCPDCTACRRDRYWSHRIVGGQRGSMANIIMLK